MQITLQELNMTYPNGKKALQGVSASLDSPSLIGLLGPNGAGKTTLMNILFGIYSADSGQILWKGEPVHFASPKDAIAAGIGMVQQHFSLVRKMTVLDNIILNLRDNRFVLDRKQARQRVCALAEKYGLTVDPDAQVGSLSVGEQQRVEILKALYRDVELLILDEPTSSLNDEDAKMLLDLLIAFKKEGLTSIIITHKLNEIIYCADKATIIRDGSTIETLVKGVDEFSEDRIIKGMVGRSMEDRYPKRDHKVQPEISFEVKNWTVHHPLYPERIVDDNVSFHVHKGEVVGFSGLQGAGRTELAMSIFGRSYGTGISGEVYLNGKKVNLKNTEDAIRHKLAYVTEDRKTNGLILGETIRFNTTLARLDKVCSGGIIDRDKEVKVAEDIKNEMGTKTPTIEQHIGNLSGGNQQKALLGKWMFTEPDVLILDEPTRGIDVGAKYDIYCLINDMVSRGKSVVMISSELPELLGMCDRIYVMNEGRLLAEVNAADATQESIMGYIIRDTVRGTAKA